MSRFYVRHFCVLFCVFIYSNLAYSSEPKKFDRSSSKSDDKFVVGLDCEKIEGKLHVGLFDTYNIPNKEMDLWDTFDLKKNDQSGERVLKVLTVKRQCSLKGKNYVIEIKGSPGNWDLNGRCGGVTYAAVKIWRSKKIIFDEIISNCQDDHRLRAIIFSPESDTPVRREGSKLTDLYP